MPIFRVPVKNAIKWEDIPHYLQKERVDSTKDLKDNDKKKYLMSNSRDLNNSIRRIEEGRQYTISQLLPHHNNLNHPESLQRAKIPHYPISQGTKPIIPVPLSPPHLPYRYPPTQVFRNHRTVHLTVPSKCNITPKLLTKMLHQLQIKTR